MLVPSKGIFLDSFQTPGIFNVLVGTQSSGPILQEVQRRGASYYMGDKMTEEQLNELKDALIDAIWFSNVHISEDELVTIGVKLINVFLQDDAR